MTKKRTKRKRAPPTKGPCEHGVKYRSNCKVCSACPRPSALHARSAAGVHQSASTVVSAGSAESAVVYQSASTIVGALSARGWGLNLEHGRIRSACKECGGSGSASTVVSALGARTAAVHQSASTVVGAIDAECGGSQICEHGQRSACKECGGSQMCEHGRQRSRCKDCGGASICEHGRRRSQCKDCRRGA